MVLNGKESASMFGLRQYKATPHALEYGQIQLLTQQATLMAKMLGKNGGIFPKTEQHQGTSIS
jgi:hypothetical protein